MDLELAFRLFNGGVLLFWALLVFLPRAKATALLVHQPVVPLVYGLAYMVLLFGAPASDGDMTSLSGVVKLMSTPQIAFAGWVHYLIFDLFVGAWEARDAQRRNLPHLAVVPCLALTLMFGPVGLLAYLTLRFALRKVSGLAESAA